MSYNKAIITNTHIKKAIEFETEANVRKGQLAPDGENWVDVIKGKTPIIITSPHSNESKRNDESHHDAVGLEALARMLNQITEASIIYSKFKNIRDPNYYDDSSFKSTLRDLINEKKPKLVIDLHGSDSYRPYDIDLGTMNGNSMPHDSRIFKELTNFLHGEGLSNISYNYFAAENNQTITKFSHNLNVTPIQLEINKTWLQPSVSELYAHRFSQLLQALVRFIHFVKSQ